MPGVIIRFPGKANVCDGLANGHSESYRQIKAFARLDAIGVRWNQHASRISGVILAISNEKWAV
ncbi:MAG: hypothetical protein Q7T82_12485 [Armatimonadota bacterium]|nr:hypothetical protein [Armatimonadota bacterium]